MGSMRTIAMLLPFFFAAITLWVLSIAMRDHRGRDNPSVRKLPNPQEMPLHRVHVAMTSARRAARAKARAEQRQARPRAPRRPGARRFPGT